MAKEPKVNWTSFTKAELIKTVKQLNVRQTKLLNRIAELERVADVPPEDEREPTIQALREQAKLLNRIAEPQPIFPWSSAVALPNPFEEGE
jgi:hypothetical protein